MAPACVCTQSDKTPIQDKPGWYRYHYRCHWERTAGDPSHIDTGSYVVPVETDAGDGAALRMAKDECPYEPHSKEK
jgi:hypothetical protein